MMLPILIISMVLSFQLLADEGTQGPAEEDLKYQDSDIDHLVSYLIYPIIQEKYGTTEYQEIFCFT